MLQIPKNVMQIGEVNPHTKVYMEDYVHTFLARRKKTEEYLAFGKKEEKSGVLYYLIYGVEKRTDWDRGSYPYFKKYERIGTVEGPSDRRVFKPVRGSGIPLDGYFIFYEQNEDMQSYMIVVREAEETAGSEEKEEVMEAVRTHREQRRKELEAAETRREQRRKEPEAAEAYREQRRKEPETAEAYREQRRKEPEAAESRQGREPKAEKNAAAAREAKMQQAKERAKHREKIVLSLQKKAKRNTAFSFGKKEKKAAFQKQPHISGQPKTHTWTIPDLCRAGSMLLLLLLVVMGLTSINQYPDMKAVTELFSDAVKAIGGRDDTVTVDAKPQEDGLIVEEAAAGQAESAEVAEAVMDEAETGEELALAENGAGTIQWMIGQQEIQPGDGNPENDAQPENDGQPENGDSTDKSAQPENGGDADKSAQSINGDGINKSAQPENSAGTDKSAQPVNTAQAEGKVQAASAEEEQTAGGKEADGQADGQANAAKNPNADDAEAETATQAIARPVSYVVKKGDSLAGIARKFYGNTAKLKEICNVNNIEDPDQIHPGQNILLP